MDMDLKRLLEECDQVQATDGEFGEPISDTVRVNKIVGTDVPIHRPSSDAWLSFIHPTQGRVYAERIPTRVMVSDMVTVKL